MIKVGDLVRFTKETPSIAYLINFGESILTGKEIGLVLSARPASLECLLPIRVVWLAGPDRNKTEWLSEKDLEL